MADDDARTDDSGVPDDDAEGVDEEGVVAVAVEVDFEHPRDLQTLWLKWVHLCTPAKVKWLFAALMKRSPTLMLVST